jgi:hypothetical protein
MKSILLTLSNTKPKCVPGAAVAALVAALCVFTLSANATTYSTDFNTGTDPGWTHYPGSPVSIALANTWTFPTISPGNQGYKLTSNAGTVPNPGRVGSFYTGITTSDFFVQTDLLNWTTSFGQDMGLTARYTSNGTATPPNAYALVLQNDQVGPGSLSALRIAVVSAGGISFLTGVANNLGYFDGTPGSSAPPDPRTPDTYRLQFWGQGTTLSASIIDLNTGLPMYFDNGTGAGVTDQISITDSTYTSGNTGLFGVIRTQQGVDPTFDNFYASTVIPEPTTLTLAGLGLGALLINRRRK